MSLPESFRDLPALMDQISDRHRLDDGDVLVALVRDPKTTQELVCVRRLALSSYLEDFDEAREPLQQVLADMPITEDDQRELRLRPLMVLARRGFNVVGLYEAEWTWAWRYGNRLHGVLSEEIVIVTEHGWQDMLGTEAAYEPALAR